jgi:molybdopterin biosynthesis enzyme
MVAANAFIVLDENVSSVKKGDEVALQMLDETMLRTDVPRFE